jgi:RNA polymerase sigma-70 factor (ECF subfamily)
MLKAGKLRKEEFKKLFDTYFDAIRRYLYYRCSDSELASDVAQDLFTRIWEKSMQIDPLKDKALLYKMASDMIISKLRRKKVELNYSSSIVIEEYRNTPESNIEYKQLQLKYSEILLKMPEKVRTTFLMSRGEGLKYTEIAERLNVSIKAIEKRMNLALALLRREISSEIE